MKISNTTCAVLLCCILFQVSAYAQSPVWKVSTGENHLFVGGTIHVLSQADYPLPGAFDAAYKKSTILVLEADMSKIMAPETRQVLIKIGTYQGEKQITHFLQPHTLQELNAYLDKNGIPFENMAKFKPGLLSAALLSVELKKLGQSGTGVDAFYNQAALRDGRTIIFLETVTR